MKSIMTSDRLNEKMEHFFGFDKINPIMINSSEDKEMLESGDCFKDWYEEELEDLYKKI